MNTVEYIKHHVYIVQAFEDIPTAEAFNIVLNFSAYASGIYGAIFKGKVITNDYLKKEFDINMLRGFDFLGEAYLDLGLAKTKGIKSKINVKERKIETVTKDIKEKTEGISIPTVLIDNVGTGKILFNINRNVPKCIMYAVEEEKLLYKMCLTNIFLNKLPVKLVNTYDEILSPKSEIWNLSNVY